jgi:hypothetical protein
MKFTEIQQKVKRNLRFLESLVETKETAGKFPHQSHYQTSACLLRIFTSAEYSTYAKLEVIAYENNSWTILS